jgi:two-component system, NarL family, nitrate/nitrite response regulator NarL
MTNLFTDLLEQSWAAKGGGMGTRVATIIIEPRLLIREALESLMANHSYRVVCAVGSTADIGSPSIVADGPKLVILGGQSSGSAVTEALGIRKLWSDSKIILLFEFASLADFQKLLTSEIDGCVPLFVAPDTLISTLDLIMIRDIRVMVVPNTKGLSIRATQAEELPQPKIKMGNHQSCDIEHEAISITIPAVQPTQHAVNGTGTADLNASNHDTQCVAPLRNLPKMSGREAQILDGLVKGQANKVIARRCDMTEATVKVHMKSIMRKIRVANRTQVAIWALENGYPAGEIEGRVHNATSIM